MNQKKWRPLPDSITIKESKIEGLGVFATKDTFRHCLGISHVLIIDFLTIILDSTRSIY